MRLTAEVVFRRLKAFMKKALSLKPQASPRTLTGKQATRSVS
ncbi:hypothetical protein GXM_06336 [Nostoc sphaeroides CCNUC1]|uniref:Uncharacterized protein n=1 Tax=Nostoc sphaeroides CCNUC1 TaxID=2653204 RepID=A0A5P8W8D6_9NOSO|nr:hypothetical protein GXM_06336 [Nostoc sphaeroides CCNUC1]